MIETCACGLLYCIDARLQALQLNRRRGIPTPMSEEGDCVSDISLDACGGAMRSELRALEEQMEEERRGHQVEWRGRGGGSGSFAVRWKRRVAK